MEQEHMPGIEEIVKHLKCQKDFKCCKSGFEALSKPADVGQGALECLDQNQLQCSFSVPSNGWRYCKCLLRSYIIKKLSNSR